MKKQVQPPRPIYLDNAASTPMDPEVIKAMVSCLGAEGVFGNSASKDHVFGWEAANVIDLARDKIAKAVGCSVLELIFTSGATESNNLALQGLARAVKNSGDRRRKIITTTVEHKAVLECCELLEKEGFHTEYLKPLPDGTVSADMLKSAMDDDTFLVSISQANSVLGSVNDIKALSAIAKEQGACYHSDCAQSNGLLDMRLAETDVTLATLTPEKIYGPKGIGALYISKDLKTDLVPMIVGGGHEKGLRGGTPATHQIAAMGEAFDIMRKDRAEVTRRVRHLRDRLVAGLEKINGAQINGSREHCLPGIVSVSFSDIDGKMLLPLIAPKVACSTGSACSSKELKPSYVLSEIGLDDDLSRASLRLSIGRFNTEEDIDGALEAVSRAVSALRRG